MGRPRDKEKKVRVNAKHLVLWLSLLIVVAIMLALAVGKIAWNDGGVYEFFKFLTNISWTLQTVFYLLLLIYYFDAVAFKVLLFAAYFQVLGLTLVIFVLVNLIFQYSPDLLTDNFDKYGVGMVVTANSIFHGVVVLVAIVVGVGYRRELLEAHGTVWESVKEDGWFKKTAIVIYQSYGTLFVLGVYNLVVDPHDVYNVEIPDWMGWVSAVLVLTGVLVVYVLVIRASQGMDLNYGKGKPFSGGSVALASKKKKSKRSSEEEEDC